MVRTLLGTNIAYYRKKGEMTQRELAEKLGICTQSVSKWEQHISCPDIMLLPKLADIFNITIEELFSKHEIK